MTLPLSIELASIGRSYQDHEVIGLVFLRQSVTTRPAQILQMSDDGPAGPLRSNLLHHFFGFVHCRQNLINQFWLDVAQRLVDLRNILWLQANLARSFYNILHRGVRRCGSWWLEFVNGFQNLQNVVIMLRGYQLQGCI
eukprot:Skav232243  [mRNA]  locus=scaffold273:47222:49069:+ [translate_table: standard]